MSVAKSKLSEIDPEPELPLDEPFVVQRDAQFTSGLTLVTLHRGQVLTDYRLIEAARVAGVPLQTVSRSNTHLTCPNCGTIVTVSASKKPPSPMELAAILGAGRR